MRDKNESLTIMVPAYNEEVGLESTVRGLVKCFDQALVDYEIIIFNDCSHDRTPDIARALAVEFPQIRCVHNEINRGLGYNISQGIQQSQKDFFIMCPGDNENSPESVLAIYQARGEADLVIPYPTNSSIRGWKRVLISRIYVLLMNFLTGYRLQYYNGTCLIPVAYAKEVPVETYGFSFQAEMLVNLLKRGLTYVEFPFEISPSRKNQSSAFRLKNIISVGKTLLRLLLRSMRSDRLADQKHPTF